MSKMDKNMTKEFYLNDKKADRFAKKSEIGNSLDHDVSKGTDRQPKVRPHHFKPYDRNMIPGVHPF